MLERLRQRLQKWRQLSWDERRLLIKALLFLPGITLALRLLDFKRVYAGLQRPFPPQDIKNKNQLMQQAHATAALVQNATYVLPFTTTCLPRSLTLWSLLRRQGIESELQIGVQQTNGEFSAHAWVEYDGIVLNDAADIRERFAAFEHLSMADGLHNI